MALTVLFIGPRKCVRSSKVWGYSRDVNVVSLHTAAPPPEPQNTPVACLAQGAGISLPGDVHGPQQDVSLQNFLFCSASVTVGGPADW